MRIPGAWMVVAGCLLGAADQPDDGGAGDVVLYDFETDPEINGWRSVTPGGVPGTEPEVAAAASAENVASGNRSLKLTFRGGMWPAVGTSHVPVRGNWSEYQVLKAVVTVQRACYVGFRVLQEKGGGEGTWNRTAYVEPGSNEITVLVHDTGYAIPKEKGDVTGFQIYVYKPALDDVVHVDHVRLSPNRPKIPFDELYSPLARNGFSIRLARQFEKEKALQRFRVAGTDWVVQDVNDLADRFRKVWQPPEERTVEQEEAAMAASVQELRKKHPRAVLARFREGQSGYALEDSGKLFSGWTDTWITCHGPDGPQAARTDSHGRRESHEIFMRHRSMLFRVDLSSIPPGSRILEARFVLTRIEGKPRKPSLIVAEPANRAWDEDANCYEYSPGKLWRAVSGLYYEGDDPDFHPVYLAYGFTGAGVCSLDFTEAVRYWVEGGRPNHGFMLFGQAHDYLRVYAREAKELNQRPLLLVIYQPKGESR